LTSNKIIKPESPSLPKRNYSQEKSRALCTHPTTPIPFGKLTETYHLGGQEKKRIKGRKIEPKIRKEVLFADQKWTF